MNAVIILQHEYLFHSAERIAHVARFLRSRGANGSVAVNLGILEYLIETIQKSIFHYFLFLL